MIHVPTPTDGREKSPSRMRLDGRRAESNRGQCGREESKGGTPVSLRLDDATIAKIEADRIYDLILPEKAGKGKNPVPVPLSFLQNVVTTGHKLERLAPAYVTRALERLSATAEVHRF